MYPNMRFLYRGTEKKAGATSDNNCTRVPTSCYILLASAIQARLYSKKHWSSQDRCLYYCIYKIRDYKKCHDTRYVITSEYVSIQGMSSASHPTHPGKYLDCCKVRDIPHRYLVPMVSWLPEVRVITSKLLFSALAATNLPISRKKSEVPPEWYQWLGKLHANGSVWYEGKQEGCVGSAAGPFL